MKVSYPNSRVRSQHSLHQLSVSAANSYRPQRMNIDDILDYGIREQDASNQAEDSSESPPRSFNPSSSSFSSFLNPHAPEFGFSGPGPSNPFSKSQQSTSSSPPSFDLNIASSQASLRDYSRPNTSAYVVQGPDGTPYQHQPNSANNSYYRPDFSGFSKSTSLSRASAPSVSRSQDYFDDYNSAPIYSQRPQHYSDSTSIISGRDSSRASVRNSYLSQSLRSRSMGNLMKSTSSSFRAGCSTSTPTTNPVTPFSDSPSAYQNHMAFSFDQAQSLSSYGEDVYGYSPLRTPTSASGSVLGATAPVASGGWPNTSQFTPPSLSIVSLPNAAPAAKASKDQKRSGVPIDGYIYQVQFKRAHRHFVLAPSAPRDIIPGDFVKVEADRGEDMGIVLAKIPAESFEEVIPTAGYRGRGFSSGQGEWKYLYRRANSEERLLLTQKVADEEKALETIREKSNERSLPMKVLDAEYQFDRHKLTFYFEADKRIDFRDLVSELFSQYKTRIWMQQVDTSSLPLHDAGTELARATGFLPQREDDFHNAGYGRTPSFGSTATLTTLDTNDTSHQHYHPNLSSSSSASIAGGNAMGSDEMLSATKEINNKGDVFGDTWGASAYPF